VDLWLSSTLVGSRLRGANPSRDAFSNAPLPLSHGRVAID
jgi:hypothetical protein